MSRGITERAGGCQGAEPAAAPQEKVSQLKDEVRLQYEKMHQILDEDLRKTMEILDKAQAKFCNENAAQVLHLNERMQEAKKLLSSIQVMFDKTEDINFMKVGTAAAAGRVWCCGAAGTAWGTVRSRGQHRVGSAAGSRGLPSGVRARRGGQGRAADGLGQPGLWGQRGLGLGALLNFGLVRTGRAAGGMRTGECGVVRGSLGGAAPSWHPRCLEAHTALGTVGGEPRR